MRPATRAPEAPKRKGPSGRWMAEDFPGSPGFQKTDKAPGVVVEPWRAVRTLER